MSYNLKDRVVQTGPRRAAFLDRDGVLNVDHGYVGSVDHLEWIAGAREAVARLNEAGYLVFVVTNQSGVARGFYTESDVMRLHSEMGRQIAEVGGEVTEFAYCPHHPDSDDPRYAIACDCRKPEPGMILGLMARHPVERTGSFLIGDKQSDLEAARGAGLAGWLFTSGSLLDFVEEVLAGSSGPERCAAPTGASGTGHANA